MQTHKNTTATVRAVMAAAKAKGAHPPDILEAAGIPMELALDPDGEVSLEQMKAFWQSAYEKSGDPYLALNAGLAAGHGAYKTLDYLLLSANTLGDGVARFIQHFRLINTWLHYEIEEDEDGYHVTLNSRIGSVPFQAVEITFGVLAARIRRMLGEAWAPEAVMFLHQPLGEAGFYAGFFRAPVAFGQERARLSFSRQSWATELPGKDEGLFRVLVSHAEQLSAARPMPDDLVARARHEVVRALSSETLEIEDVAAALGVGTRTLQRRFADQATSFSALVDEVREDQARNLVAGKAMSLSEVAFFLGFSDQSAFSRAFKRWTGQTPKSFRLAA